MLEALDCDSAAELFELVRTMVPAGLRIAGDPTLIEAGEDDERAGRDDDERRAADLTQALADERVAGIVALRGGAWLTRVLPRIDFTVLRRRRTRVALFGFSELTTVLNIAATYRQAVCWYDLGPAFIPTGLAQWARQAATSAPADSPAHNPRGLKNAARKASLHTTAARNAPSDGGFLWTPMLGSPPPTSDFSRWARGEFRKHLAVYFADVVGMIEGQGSSRRVHGSLVRGRLPARTPAVLVGGTLSVLISLIGTPYARSIFRPGHWLVLEDVNEAPHRLDRMLAHLKLAGILNRCGGLLLGDFHEDDRDRIEQVLASLARLLPRQSPLPIVVSRDFGHTWPMSPLPLGRPVLLRASGRSADRRVQLEIPWSDLAVR